MKYATAVSPLCAFNYKRTSNYLLDFTPYNILLRTTGLDGLTEDEVIHALGEPQQTLVLNQAGESPTKLSAPKYLVYPVDWSSVALHFMSEHACIIDFGESFEASHPPEDLGIPGSYQSPELILDKTVGFGCDVWALGCTLFEIRTGRKLFCPFDDDPDNYLDEMVLLLGKLPEPWWSTTWEMRKKWYQDETDSQGRVLHIEKTTPPEVVYENPDTESRVHPSVAEGARSLQEKLAPGLWYVVAPRHIHREISAEEIEIFADLLSKLLKFDPNDRLKVKAIQDHEWFRM
jgi:serine/threonine protein kinase